MVIAVVLFFPAIISLSTIVIVIVIVIIVVVLVVLLVIVWWEFVFHANIVPRGGCRGTHVLDKSHGSWIAIDQRQRVVAGTHAQQFRIVFLVVFVGRSFSFCYSAFSVLLLLQIVVVNVGFDVAFESANVSRFPHCHIFLGDVPRETHGSIQDGFLHQQTVMGNGVVQSGSKPPNLVAVVANNSGRFVQARDALEVPQKRLRFKNLFLDRVQEFSDGCRRRWRLFLVLLVVAIVVVIVAVSIFGVG
mmetsp:Transcript_14641/g.31230  ORF Transcript_14641/g.31230 Transcript_14641/m.31230 type:complete len:246 (+) Transcript_14641:91-828(+)